MKQKPSVERLEGQTNPSQESVMVVSAVEAFPPGTITNQQDEHNGESCLNVTNKDTQKKKHWWQHWSSDEKKQDHSTKPSDEGGPTIHNLPPADYEVINILGR